MAANEQATENNVAAEAGTVGGRQDDDSPDWKKICKRGAFTLGKFANDLQDIVKAYNKIAQVDELSNKIKSGSCSKWMLHNEFDKIIGDPQKCLVLKEMLDNNSILMDLWNSNGAKIENELLQFKKSMAEFIVMTGAISSGVLIVMQVIKLYQVFSEVSDASNILEESKQEFEIIRQNVKKLFQCCTEIQDVINNSETASAREINSKVRRTNALYVKTNSMICNIKLQIGGKIQNLTVYREDQGMDAISSLVLGATNTVQLLQLHDLLSSPVFALQAAITTLFFALSAASARACYVTHKKLDELRKAMDEIKQMETKLDAILHY